MSDECVCAHVTKRYGGWGCGGCVRVTGVYTQVVHIMVVSELHMCTVHLGILNILDYPRYTYQDEQNIHTTHFRKKNTHTYNI